jgi:hypothetical protein
LVECFRRHKYLHLSEKRTYVTTITVKAPNRETASKMYENGDFEMYTMTADWECYAVDRRDLEALAEVKEIGNA